MSAFKTAIGAGSMLCALLVGLLLLYMSIAYVPAGHVGVLTLFGRVTGDVLPEGTHMMNPFKHNNTLSVRTQEIKETASVPSNEGLIITLDTSLLFRLDPDKAANVYRSLGPQYATLVVEPNLRSAIRGHRQSQERTSADSRQREVRKK